MFTNKIIKHKYICKHIKVKYADLHVIQKLLQFCSQNSIYVREICLTKRLKHLTLCSNEVNKIQRQQQFVF